MIHFHNCDLEAQAIDLHLEDGTKFSVFNYYNPNKDVTLIEFQHYLKQLQQQHIMVGDMNAHISILRSNDHSNTTGRNLELLLSKEDICLLNPINLYTYTDRRTGNQSCLDICLASSNIIELCSLGVMDDVGSDHCPLNTIIDASPKTHYQ